MLFFALNRACDVYQVRIVSDDFAVESLDLRQSPPVVTSQLLAKHIAVEKEGIFFCPIHGKGNRQAMTDELIELCSTEAIVRRTGAGQLESVEIKAETAKVLEMLRKQENITVHWE